MQSLFHILVNQFCIQFHHPASVWSEDGPRVNKAILTFMLFSSLQENPSEEDAAVVDKVMSSRMIKNEVDPDFLPDTPLRVLVSQWFPFLICVQMAPYNLWVFR